MKRSTSALGLLLVSAVLIHAGCIAGVPSSEALCEHLCGCAPAACNGSEGSCVTRYQQFKKEADESQCGAEHDDYVACLDALSCADLDAGRDCNGELRAYARCETPLDFGSEL